MVVAVEAVSIEQQDDFLDFVDVALENIEFEVKEEADVEPLLEARRSRDKELELELEPEDDDDGSLVLFSFLLQLFLSLVRNWRN